MNLKLELDVVTKPNEVDKVNIESNVIDPDELRYILKQYSQAKFI